MPSSTTEAANAACAAYETKLFAYAMTGCPWRYTGTCAATRHACGPETCAVWHGLKQLFAITTERRPAP